MFSTSDTIVAIATPPGRGGIGVVRISGPEAHAIAMTLTARQTPFEPRHATLARFSGQGVPLDSVLVTTFVAPNSYTGDDIAEISAHGSPVLLRSIVTESMRSGARLANPGEFTLRAFLNRRIDLVQAEAVRDLIEAVTPLQARAAFDQLEGTLTAEIEQIEAALFDLAARLEASLDFPDEGYHFVAEGEVEIEIGRVIARIDQLLHDAERGRLVRDGLHVVLAGRPNSGKSSVFNQLAGAGRAIVTDVPGTTRDLVTETVDIEGVAVTLVDTAGIRHAPTDAIEAEGIARAVAARRVAALVLVVLDGSIDLGAEDLALLRDTGGSSSVVAVNKADLGAQWPDAAIDRPVIRVSALTGEGFAELREAIVMGMSSSRSDRDVPAVTNLRHAELLAGARASLERAADAAGNRAPEEFVLADIHEARASLEEITGKKTPDDVLDRIFSVFCIGK